MFCLRRWMFSFSQAWQKNMGSGRSQSSGNGGSRGCFTEHRQNVCLSVYVQSIVRHNLSVHSATLSVSRDARHTSILVYFFDAYGHYVDLVYICRQLPKRTCFFGTFCFFYRFLIIFVVQRRAFHAMLETKKNDGLWLRHNTRLDI